MINKSYFQTRIGKVIAGSIGIMFLFYMISCGSANISPSSNAAVGSITSLTLSEVSADSITLDWELLKTKEGVAVPGIVYTVYAETPDEKGVFTNIPPTETVYTLSFPVELGGGRSSTVLPVEGTGNRAAGVKVTNLVNDTPYRIVVEARDASGNTRVSRLFAYTASALADSDISGLAATTTNDSEEVTVTWEPKQGAQSYLLQANEGGNQFGGSISTDSVLEVVCPPDSLLCERRDQLAEPLADGRLKYILRVNKKEGRYKLAVIPFNFQDLKGLRAVDEEGRVRVFTEEVLAQVENEGSALSQRLKDSSQAQEVQIKVSMAGAPTDLVLESTGNTLSAKWGHGIGAEYYYVILISKGVAVTNIIDRYEASGRFAGGGYIGFSDLTANTAYTVTVQSFTVIDKITNVGGYDSATLFTKKDGETLDAPQKVTEGDLTLINDEAEKLQISWSTPEANSVIGYNVFYWVGDVAPNKPQYLAEAGGTNLTFTVPPGSYRVRIDVLSSYTEEVVTGDTQSIVIYRSPLPPKNLAITFNRGSFADIGNKLYAIGYPLTYTEAETPLEAGGPVEDLAYHYRYQVGEGEWIGYSEIAGEAMISLQVDDLSDATVVKSGYGKNYQVEVIASNAGGFVSEVEALEFTYQSFPEPFIQSNNLVVETGDRSLTVTWRAPSASEANGSDIFNYIVTLNLDPDELSIQSNSISTTERKMVFENLENNQPYFITVVPHSAVTGNIFTALSLVTDYTIDEALAVYTGEPAPYTPQGPPEAVVGLEVVADADQATVTWSESSTGSPATRYVLEYLTDVRATVVNIDVTGDVADAELSRLSWGRATSIDVMTNDSGSYSQVISNLNVLSTINVFRVKGVHTDISGKEWASDYRYYALGSDISRAPSTVGDLFFSEHAERSFKVTWNKPDDAGRDTSSVAAQLVGYRVSWGTTAEADEGWSDIDVAKTLSYIVTGLTPSTQYYVKVQAKNDNQEGKTYNAGSTGSTYTIKKPGMVASIFYSEHSTNSLKVSWDAVTDAGYGLEGAYTSVGYLLDLYTQGEWRSIPRSDYSAIEETLTGLDPGTGYQVRVTVTNRFPLYSAVSEGRETWTLSMPGPVGGLVVSDPAYDEESHTGGFKVSWEAPLDTGRTSTGNLPIVTGYVVAYAEVVDTPRVYTPVAHDVIKTEYVFTGLKTNAKYDIRVQAKNGNGTGIEKLISGWVPSPPGAVDPDSITFSLSKFSTIQITWDAPEPGRAGGSSSGNVPTLYNVEIVPEEDKGNENAYSLVQDNHSTNVITANGLTKATSYHVRVTAKNERGSASASVSTFTGTTLDDVPTPPSAVRDLKVKYFDDRQVVLTWAAPIDKGTTNGVVPATLSGYKVKYKIVDSSGDFINIDENNVEVRLKERLRSTNTTATVLGLDASTKYTFLVAAINSSSKITPDADAATVEQMMAVPAPENFAINSSTCKVVDGKQGDDVELTWDVSPGATYYKLYRSTYPSQDVQEIVENINGTSYSQTGLTIGTIYYYAVRACNDDGCSGNSELLEVNTLRDNSFWSLINSAKIPTQTDLVKYDQRSREIITRYTYSGGVDRGGETLEVRYVRKEGTGKKDGSSYADASGSLKTVLDGITASSTKVYLVLLEGGRYDITQTINMKNHVAIVGGVNGCLEFSDTEDEITILDGGRVRVIYNKDINHTALLYGVTIANGGTFSLDGGAVYNESSSPTFMWVTFTGNNAQYGGAVYNKNSSPVFIGATFSGNSANLQGGGMYNKGSSPILIGVTFSGNTAQHAKGMYNDNPGKDGPLIVNSILTGEQRSQIDRWDSGTEKFRIYNSAVSTRWLYSTGNNPVQITFANNVSADPQLDTSLLYHGGLVKTYSIPSDSPVVNQGLHVKNKGNTFYYSKDDPGKDDTAWYTKPDLSGTQEFNVPADAVDLTAIDATGYARTGRPDIGTYEAR